jgi:predicted kinase
VFSAVGSGVPGVMEALLWHPARTSIRNVANRTGFAVFVIFLMAFVPPISQNAQL